MLHISRNPFVLGKHHNKWYGDETYCRAETVGCRKSYMAAIIPTITTIADREINDTIINIPFNFSKKCVLDKLDRLRRTRTRFFICFPFRKRWVVSRNFFSAGAKETPL
jgi:hypothetical protein